MKITTDQVMEWEKESLIGALLDGSFELNDEFVGRYAGETVRAILTPVDVRDRAFVLDGNIGESFFNGGIPSLDDTGFLLPCTEIETPFEGTAADVFEEPDEYHISGDFAYLYVGYGLTVAVDVDGLRASVADLA